MRRRFRALLEGLLAKVATQELLDDRRAPRGYQPYGMRYLLSRAAWDAGTVRDDLRAYVVEQLGSAGAVLVVNETGD